MFELQLLTGNYVVCRLAPDEPVPAWALGDLVSTTRTPEELSIVCRDTDVPGDVQSEPGWRCLRVAGKLDFSLVGVIAKITTVLADAEISVFTISTFDTDYFLVREIDWDRAIEAWNEAGMKTSD